MTGSDSWAPLCCFCTQRLRTTATGAGVHSPLPEALACGPEGAQNGALHTGASQLRQRLEWKQLRKAKWDSHVRHSCGGPGTPPGAAFTTLQLRWPYLTSLSLLSSTVSRGKPANAACLTAGLRRSSVMVCVKLPCKAQSSSRDYHRYPSRTSAGTRNHRPHPANKAGWPRPVSPVSHPHWSCPFYSVPPILVRLLLSRPPAPPRLRL